MLKKLKRKGWLSKLIYGFLILIFTSPLLIGTLIIISSPSYGIKCIEYCHLLYDPIDQIYYCIGSEIDCCCKVEN